LAHLKEFLVSQATLSSQSIAPKPQRSKSPDFDRLINMIRELNSIAGNYQSVELCYTNCGATFKPPDAIVLTLYRNGITLDDSDVFRPFDALPTLQFIQDIYDGYFPTELQSKYPEGITLVVSVCALEFSRFLSFEHFTEGKRSETNAPSWRIYFPREGKKT